MNMNISCRIANANTQCGRITNPPERRLEEPKRNIETLLGRAYNGSGKSFYIYFRGVNTIHYDPYRHMNPYQYYPSPYFCPLR